MSRTADLVIVGGGIQACSTALHARMRGLSVIVIEKDTVARHASGVNAGGVRRMNRDYAELALSQRSMEIWNRIETLLDDDCGFQRAPQIKVAETEAQLDEMRARVADLSSMGYDHEVVLDQTQLRALVPAVSPHLIGALASLDDGFALPYQTTFAFQRKARALGACFHEGLAVEAVRRQGADWQISCRGGETFTGRYLLNCTGAWAGRLARQLGENAPIEAVAPMMLVTARLPHFCNAVVGGPVGRPLSFKQMANGTVVIGGGRRGTPDPDTNVSEIRFEHLRLSAAAALAIFPIMAQATIVRSWSGLEGFTPDDLPILGRSSTAENAFYACGFSGHGFQLGPGVGEVMAELIATSSTSTPIEKMSIKRFN